MGHQDVRLDVPGHLEPPCPRHPAPTVVIRGPVAIGGIAQPAIPLARTESAAPGTAQPSGISRTSTRTVASCGRPPSAASRQPLTTVVRPWAAKCYSTMSSRCRSGVSLPRPPGTARCTYRTAERHHPWRTDRTSTGRRDTVGLDIAIHGSGLPSACAICRQWLQDSVKAGFPHHHHGQTERPPPGSGDSALAHIKDAPTGRSSESSFRAFAATWEVPANLRGMIGVAGKTVSLCPMTRTGGDECRRRLPATSAHERDSMPDDRSQPRRPIAPAAPTDLA